jgi:hypothetical protein
MSKEIKFDYSKLRPMDMVVCAGRSPFAMTTRIVTAGIRKAFDHTIAVHTGVLVDFHGQLLVAEMGPKGLGINSLHRYRKEGGRRWVITFRRNSAYDDTAVRETAQKRIAKDRRKTIQKYDYKGLLEFVFKRVKDNPKRTYCSEYFYLTTFEDGLRYPISFKAKVSPYDLQLVGNGWTNILDWKL